MKYVFNVRDDSGKWKWIDGTEMNMNVLDPYWAPGQPGNKGGTEDGLEILTNYKLNDITTSAYKRYTFICKIDCSKTSPSWKGKGWYRFTKPAGSKMTESASTEPR